jgi:hypothetical protein
VPPARFRFELFSLITALFPDFRGRIRAAEGE